MTATIDLTDSTDTTMTATAATAVPAPGVDLLDMLYARVAAVAFDEPDEFHSWHDAGRELLELAATARRATAYLGGHAGTIVTRAPGVVVVRELVAATRALADVVALTSRA